MPETSVAESYRSSIPSIINFGARMYDPLTGSWLTPDPLAHKYTSLSPYAYCAGNPVNFVDPDGRRWINKNGQIVYNQDGLSPHASYEEIQLANEMNRTRTGRAQLQKLIGSGFDVTVIINGDTFPSEYGINRNFGIIHHKRTNSFIPYKGSEITIYKKKAATRSQYLSTLEAMAVNFSHEIEHITSENCKLQFYKFSKEDIEYHPQEITREIINEYYIMKPLNSIEKLQILINTIITSQLSTNTTDL